MARINIDRNKCKGCLLCVKFCSQGLIEVDPRLNRRGTNPARFKKGSDCAGCTMCAIICPDCCIEVYK